MRLDELFSRRPGVSVWVKSGGNLAVDHGRDGFGLRAAKMKNRLKVKPMVEGEQTERFVVEPYHDPVSGHGPYFRVVDTKTKKEAGQLVKGVAYPADGFQTRRSAETVAKRLNRGEM